MSSADQRPSLFGRPRRRRWDAGQVSVTKRDLTVLRWAGEMYGPRDDALRVLLTSLTPASHRLTRPELSDRTVRVWLERMERAGYLTRRRLLGRAWLTPTRSGLDLAGLPYERWNFGARSTGTDPSGWGLEHTHTVAMVRFALAAEYPDGVWTPEREFSRQRQGSGAQVRLPDGAIDVSTGRIGVEVELSRKLPERYGYILGDVDPSLDALRWYTTAALRPWLERTLASTPQLARVDVGVIPHRVVHGIPHRAPWSGAS